MNELLLAALLSMTPVGELRVGLPVALASGINPLLAYVVCVIANIAIIPIFMVFLEFIHYRFLHVKAYRTGFDIFMERTRRRTQSSIEKYGAVGLILFTAIPFPGTGAYTATLAAWFFGIDKWKSFLAISAGVLISGSIMLGVFVGVVTIMGL